MLMSLCSCIARLLASIQGFLTSACMLRVQAARAHAVEMEEQAQDETVGAEEAFLLLGDAEITVSHLLLQDPLPVHRNCAFAIVASCLMTVGCVCTILHAGSMSWIMLSPSTATVLNHMPGAITQNHLMQSLCKQKSTMLKVVVC